eukprot:5732410-Amphidinium_carterae.2
MDHSGSHTSSDGSDATRETPPASPHLVGRTDECFVDSNARHWPTPGAPLEDYMPLTALVPTEEVPDWNSLSASSSAPRPTHTPLLMEIDSDSCPLTMQSSGRRTHWRGPPPGTSAVHSSR